MLGLSDTLGNTRKKPIVMDVTYLCHTNCIFYYGTDVEVPFSSLDHDNQGVEQ